MAGAGGHQSRANHLFVGLVCLSVIGCVSAQRDDSGSKLPVLGGMKKSSEVEMEEPSSSWNHFLSSQVPIESIHKIRDDFSQSYPEHPLTHTLLVRHNKSWLGHLTQVLKTKNFSSMKISSHESPFLLGSFLLADSVALIRKNQLELAMVQSFLLLNVDQLPSHIYLMGMRLFLLLDSKLGTGELLVENQSNALAWESDMCRLFCDTAAWRSVSEDYPRLLTDRSAMARFVTDYQFIHQFKLNAFDSIAKQEKPNQKLLEESLPPTRPMDLVTLKKLVREKKWNFLSKIEIAPKKPAMSCDSTYLYQFLARGYASRFTQNRKDFLFQFEKFFSELNKYQCRYSDFLFKNETEFNEFLLSENLWVARLYWENGDLKRSESLARMLLARAEQLGSPELILEAFQLILGRILPERSSNSKIYEEAHELFLKWTEKLGLDGNIYARKKLGLISFSSGYFSKSLEDFDWVLANSNSNSDKSFATYWRARALRGLKKDTQTKETLLKLAELEPLGYYDSLSGQLLGNPSGKASTLSTSPFPNGWKQELDLWWPSRKTPSWLIWEEFPWEAGFKKNRWDRVLTRHTGGGEQNLWDLDLAFCLFLVRAISESGGATSQMELEKLLLDQESLEGFVFSGLLKSMIKKDGANPAARPSDFSKIGAYAWLQYISGNTIYAIQYVGRFQEEFIKNGSKYTFLFFMYYPRPFLEQFQQASSVCNVDVDLLYAISRQESLFQPEVVSGAGAVGLMQLLPATAKRVLANSNVALDSASDLKKVETNLLAGACYLRELIDRYQGNLFFAVAAYNAGELQVDRWVANRHQLKDVPMFIEHIPFGETQGYVKKVFRNYYNMKWVYSN